MNCHGTRMRLAVGACALATLTLSSGGESFAQQREFIRCPVDKVRAQIETPIPDPWWQTPQLGSLTGVDIRTIGGDRTLVCLYRAYGQSVPVMRKFPLWAKSCRVDSSRNGFDCSAGQLSAGSKNRCHASVQDRIAWDYKGTKRWGEANLKRLCGNATDSDQPGVCFARVMHGNVSYGSGNRWRWQNAVDLCTGSRNAEKTVGCFEAAIRSKTPWKQAIANCRGRS